MIRIATLNVNGIRSAGSKGLMRWVKRAAPDVLCLQEVKAHEADIPDQLRKPDGLNAALARGEAAKVQWVQSGEVVPAKVLAEKWGLTPQA